MVLDRLDDCTHQPALWLRMEATAAEEAALAAKDG